MSVSLRNTSIIDRSEYIEQLLAKRWNGKVKIVTGSNSKMLSKDIVTNFRNRGSEIKVYPLSFAEYLPVAGMEKADALEEY